jgi:hypothetical protein
LNSSSNVLASVYLQSKLLGYLFVGFAVLTSVSMFFRIVFVLATPAGNTVLDLWEVMGALLWGIRFDMSVSALMMLLVVIWANVRLRLPMEIKLGCGPVCFCAVLLVTMQIVDLFYYRNFGLHLGFEVLARHFNGESLLSLLSDQLLVVGSIHCCCSPRALSSSFRSCQALYRRK